MRFPTTKQLEQVFQPMPDKPYWNTLPDARPYCAIIGFAFDKAGNFPILFRSDKVRSAKNIWSLVAGLHEVGRTVTEQFAAEAKEELNLDVCGEATPIGYFEEIIPGDHWHWIMLIVAAPVTTLDTMKNVEPEKHPNLTIVNAQEFYKVLPATPWSAGAKPAFLKHQNAIELFTSKEMHPHYESL